MVTDWQIELDDELEKQVEILLEEYNLDFEEFVNLALRFFLDQEKTKEQESTSISK